MKLVKIILDYLNIKKSKDTQKELLDFLDSKGFLLKERIESGSFGDYSLTFTSSKFDLRLSRGRSAKAIDIDICSIDDRSGGNFQMPNWYDLSLIKEFVYHEDFIDKADPLEVLFAFLKQEFETITELFSPTKYPETKEKLNALRERRVAKRFPNL